LAAFLIDPVAIKQFEQLFSVVDSIAPDVVDQIRLEIASATAAANAAMDIAMQKDSTPIVAQEFVIDTPIIDTSGIEALQKTAIIERSLISRAKGRFVYA
jgi:hypothetical protein